VVVARSNLALGNTPSPGELTKEDAMQDDPKEVEVFEEPKAPEMPVPGQDVSMEPMQIDLRKKPSGPNCPEIQKIPKEQRTNLLPPIGTIVWSIPIMTKNNEWVKLPYRVTYVNEAKLRVSIEPFAYHKRCEPHEIPQLPPELEEKRRRETPFPHEEDRNPDNVTLGVQSGVLGSKTKFTK
jgi:hypothetical protein